MHILIIEWEFDRIVYGCNWWKNRISKLEFGLK